ncbi:MAG: pilus assembly protein [Alphaproteobacteria bacterium]|nr:pilus assembly protein [Alphaproteobacteria bacterium]
MARVLKLTARVLASLAAKNCIRHDDGAVLVEAAIVLPVMVLVILGGLDLGLGMLAATQLNFTTEAAARCQAINATPCSGGGNATISYANSVAQNTLVSGASFTVTTLSCGVQVTGNYSYSSIYLPYSIPITISACYPVVPPSGNPAT